MLFLRIIVLSVLLAGPVSVMAAPGLAHDWVLRGTLVSGQSHGMAIIEQAGSGEQRVVKQDGTLPGGLQLVAVHKDYAVVQNGGDQYRLNYGDRIDRLPEAQASAYTLHWTDLPSLMEQLEVIPHQQQGRVVGYYIHRIHGDIGDKIGLKRGDLLLSVNGLDLNDELEPGRLYQELDNANLNLTLRRQGKRLQVSYQVRP